MLGRRRVTLRSYLLPEHWRKRPNLHPNSGDIRWGFPAPGRTHFLMRIKMLFAMGGLFVGLVPCFPARASLGGDMATVRDDQAKLQGTLRTTNNNSYNIHEIQGASGVVVREYVTPSGSVFGVAWQGRRHPDLHQVLGAYYDSFVQAAQAQRAQRRGRGPVLIQQPGLVVQLGGHMGSLTGRAFLPQSLPAGVHAEEIR